MAGKQVSGHYKAFYPDGFKIGIEAIENGLTDESLKISTKQIYQNIDGLIESLLVYAEKQETKVFCQKGCSCCCFQPVFALTHEIKYIQDFINDNFMEKEVEAILIRADEKDQKIGGLTKENIQNSKHPCPLLKDGACLVYEVRPMACRIYLSLNFQSCETFYSNPENPSGFPQLMEFPLQAGRMMNEGYKAALKQAGWVSQEFRIEEGLLAKIAF